MVQMLPQIGGRARRAASEPATTVAISTIRSARRGCTVVAPRTCLSVPFSPAWHSCSGAVRAWSWALTGGQKNEIAGSASTMRAISSTSALREERSSPVSGSRTKVPTPSVERYVRVPSRVRSKRGSRPPSTNERGAVARARSTRSGVSLTTPSPSTSAPCRRKTSSAGSHGKQTPMRSRISSVAA